MLGFMRWVNDYKILRDNEDADENELIIYESRLRYIQNCIDSSKYNRGHILLNELWRNSSADTHAKHLRMKKDYPTKYSHPALGEEGDDEAREKRNEDKIMAELIENLRSKHGDVEINSFYGDEERVKTIKNIYENQNILKNKNIENGIVNTTTKTATQEYNKLKNYDVINLQRENKKDISKKNYIQIEGIYIYLYIFIYNILNILYICIYIYLHQSYTLDLRYT